MAVRAHRLTCKPAPHEMAFWKKRTPDPASPESPAVSPGAAEGGPAGVLLSGDMHTDRATVRVLLDAVARLAETRELAGLLEHIVDTAVSTTGAERGFLLLEPEPGAELDVRVARDRRGGAVPEGERWSTSVVRKVQETRLPVRTTVSGHEDLDLGQSVFDLKLRAVMCVPLRVRGVEGKPDQAGALYVDSRAGSRDFTPSDLALFHALAQHVGIALENGRRAEEAIERVRLEQAVAFASEIQRGLLPRELKVPAGFQASGWYRPAEHASGDFYDGLRLPDGSGALMVGDMTGHGVGPALLVASAQAGLRAWLRSGESPGVAVRRTEEDLAERMDSGTFLTLMLVTFGADGSLAVVDAGHGAGLIWRKSTGQVESLGRRGPALGVMPGFDHLAHPAGQLEPGDLLLLFTDGLSETADATGELLGEAALEQVLGEVGRAGGNPEQLCEAVVARAEAFGGGVHEDDWTLVALRRTPTEG